MRVDATFFVVFRRAAYWPRFRMRFARKDPKLKPGEAAVKINLDCETAIWDPPCVAIEVRTEHVIRPKVEGKAE